MSHNFQVAETRAEGILSILGIAESEDIHWQFVDAAKRSRAETVEGMIAEALPLLLTYLIRYDASHGAHAALQDLIDYVPDYGHPEGVDRRTPLFTESYLYELLGKDHARSVLGRIRALAKVMGYKGETG